MVNPPPVMAHTARASPLGRGQWGWQGRSFPGTACQPRRVPCRVGENPRGAATMISEARSGANPAKRGGNSRSAARPFFLLKPFKTFMRLGFPYERRSFRGAETSGRGAETSNRGAETSTKGWRN
jgi:hypothetical protein